jgi:hypothetical protein
MSMEVLKLQRKEMLREAELNRLKKALRAECKGPAASQWISTVVRDLARVAVVLRKSFRTQKNAD